MLHVNLGGVESLFLTGGTRTPLSKKNCLLLERHHENRLCSLPENVLKIHQLGQKRDRERKSLCTREVETFGVVGANLARSGGKEENSQ